MHVTLLQSRSSYPHTSKDKNWTVIKKYNYKASTCMQTDTTKSSKFYILEICRQRERT